MITLPLLTTEQIERQRQLLTLKKNREEWMAIWGDISALAVATGLLWWVVHPWSDPLTFGYGVLVFIILCSVAIGFSLRNTFESDATQNKLDLLADAAQPSCAELANYKDHPDVQDCLQRLQLLDRVFTRQEAQALLELARRDMERDRCKSLYLGDVLATAN